ncbi:MAG: hypothetical protein LBU31_04150 [Coriobacteriales bacterium]|jgi:hypothetical protein|nr:hypothetical protein [Coriobacteriales bacterium]
MRFELLCPACGVRGFDFDDYESLVLLAPNLALAQFKCPGCGIHLSATLKLSPQTQHVIQQRLNAAGDGVAQDAVANPARETTCATTAAQSDSAHAVQARATDPPEDAHPRTPSVPNDAPVPVPAQPGVTALDPSLLSYASSLIVDEGELGIDIIRPLRVGSADIRAHLEYFKRQLDDIETVDEAIEEIDTGYYHEKRDV